ncbi:YihY/virulence factor BrkB family protein [Myxococcus llanfairpwllgwyngyllgogerychwyrndrobwllllantysiliogogogochensis]|uniref:YihY/virulence factor BrkB family protein n=1 Tax=Myxococcus llanfairpwllgwyngyllgogerychwyrndrobwllllantysiliogogogochensis TaxID=2590453 RepID=A0A540WRE3_9BACT|nr:YihY/virulence factor BrkB family protein [Myxococcus llanfairpwllgwyngyllgogerychwyrndrobwllllantysiliogogogochensis]TQF11591.1 YihY/virulence factor BrkB family protein [Myxococcus llanfairpwllgwyngyllgogerychwyrndrobwllllantysiliogogogochensis]
MRLPRLKYLTWREFTRRFVKEFQEDTVTDIAAQLSYYLLFSLFPFLFFLVTLVAYLPFAPGAVDAMLDRVRPLVPGDALGLVTGHLTSLVHQPRPKLLTVGLLVALWSASRGVDALRKALNLAYDVPESRPVWKTQGLAMVMTLIGTLLIPLSFAVFLLGGKLGAWLATRLHVQEDFYVLWSWVRWPFTAGLVMLVLSLCYYLLPDVKQRFKYITPGSIFGTLVWMASTWGFTQYVEHFGKYNVTYGSIGGVVVLLLWLYISGLVFILGGELNAILEHASAEGKEKGARQFGEPAPAEPPIKTPGAAKSAASAKRSRLAFWRWRRRVARGKSPEPSAAELERGPPSTLH